MISIHRSGALAGIALGFAVAGPLAAAAKDSEPPNARKKAPTAPAPTFPNVAYGPHERHVLDFWKAESDKPTPLVLFIHGGGWINGDKFGFNKPMRYLSAGISVAAINYRFIPQAEADGLKPPVQGPLRDAARALQFLRSKAAEWNLDKPRVGATAAARALALRCGWPFIRIWRTRRARIPWRGSPRGSGAPRWCGRRRVWIRSR